MFAALGPLLEMLLASGGAEAGAAEAGAAGAEGEAAAAGRATKAQKAEDSFNKLFKDDSENAAPQEGPAAGKALPKEQDGMLDRLKKLNSGLDQFDKQLGDAAKFAEKLADVGTDAVQNRFVPLLRDVLPENMGRLLAAAVQLTNAFIDRGKELAQFSGQLSEAQAISDVKETMADIREARELEGPVSSMTTSATDIWIEIRDILLPLKRAMATVLANVLEKIDALLQMVGPPLKVGIELLSTLIEVVYDVGTFQPLKAIEAIDALPDRLAKAMKDGREDEQGMLDDLFRQLFDHPFGPHVHQAQPRPPGGLGVPLFA